VRKLYPKLVAKGILGDGDDPVVGAANHECSASRLETHFNTLTTEQLSVHLAVMDSVLNAPRDHSNIFSLMAPGGCGKTHVYSGIIKDCQSCGIPFVATAFTAIAALLLPFGETCHRAFGIPIRGRTDGNERSYIEASSDDGIRLTAVRLIVMDETSMLSLWQVILIDHLFRVSNSLL